MNIFFRVNNELVTPQLNDTILSGITRDSLIQLANHINIPCKEEKIYLEQTAAKYKNGTLTEAFGAGTAATIARINSIDYKGTKLAFKQTDDSYANKLKMALQDIQYGRSDDPFGWRVEIK